MFNDIAALVILSANHLLLLWIFPWHSLHNVRVVRVLQSRMGALRDLSSVCWYAGIWSSVSATCCWSSWSRSHVTRPSRNPCCRAWAEPQTTRVITRDQDVIAGFYVWIVGWRLSRDGNAVSYFVPYIPWDLLSHLWKRPQNAAVWHLQMNKCAAYQDM